MNRLSAFGVVVLGLVLTVPARAQSAEAAIAEARSLVRRAAEPFDREVDADRCVRELARAIVVGLEAVRALPASERAKAADALNLTTINAAFARATSTRGLDVTRDLLARDEAAGMLELEHLGLPRHDVLRCFRVLHELSRCRDGGEHTSKREYVQTYLDEVETLLRGMIHTPALETYVRVLAFHLNGVVRAQRARTKWVGGLTIHRVRPMAHVGAIVDKAYVEARTLGVGPRPEEARLELRGLVPGVRAGSRAACVARLEGERVARFDVEVIGEAGERMRLTRVSPDAPSFELEVPWRDGRFTVLVSALLEDDRVLARTFPLDVGATTAGGSTPAPSIGLAGRLAGQGGGIRVAVDDVVVPGKGGSIRIDFDGSTPASFTLELVGAGGERRVIARDEPLEPSATNGTTMVVSLGAHEVPAAPTSWRVVVTARRADGTTTTAAAPLAVRGARRVS